MNANEVAFVAEAIHRGLMRRQFLRMAVVKQWGDVPTILAAEIAFARREWRKAHADEKAVPADLDHVRAYIGQRVPADFSWWLEIHSEVGPASYAVRFRWRGMNGVTRVGGESDPDYSIMCRLLEMRNWDEERALAVVSVDAQEAAKLTALQTIRRAHLLGSPRVEGVGVQVASIAESRRPAARAALTGERSAGSAHVTAVREVPE